MELIRNHTKNYDPKIAFSTTNYHVFRSGVFASRQGIRAEGIGAKTKIYFWINAFIIMRQEDSDFYKSEMNCRQPVRADFFS